MDGFNNHPNNIAHPGYPGYNYPYPTPPQNNQIPPWGWNPSPQQYYGNPPPPPPPPPQYYGNPGYPPMHPSMYPPIYPPPYSGSYFQPPPQFPMYTGPHAMQPPPQNMPVNHTFQPPAPVMRGASGAYPAAPIPLPTMNAGPSNAPMPARSVVFRTKEDEDTFDWSQGDQRREIPLSEADSSNKWKATKWPWRSAGGIRSEKRLCIGVCICGGCGRPVRPKTNTKALKIQLEEGICDIKTCASYLTHIKCDVYSIHSSYTRDGTTYLVWEQHGVHNHIRPPGGRLSESEEDMVDTQVMRRSEASSHSLRTGDPGPGSVPLTEISSVLANPRAARYRVAQSQQRLGLSSGTTGKGFTFDSIIKLQESLGEPFIIESSLHGPAYLMFQTSFMKKTMDDSVRSWSADISEAPHMASRGRGLVTDGDHSFFGEGILNMTCVFNTTMSAWVPVLYTWILHADIIHNRCHFRNISQSIVKLIMDSKIKFEPKYLLHVMDFSQAQLSAHTEEYADALIAMKADFSSLTEASQKIERASYLLQAQEAASGCDFHFWQTAERVKKNGALVSATLHSEFDHLLRILRGTETSQEEFLETVSEFRVKFPRTNGWLSWWLRPKFASMIFPAYSVMDPTVASQIPKTGNPAEHSHSLLHHAVGKDHDLIPGIKKLHLHVKELESQHKLIIAGHFNPPPVREYKRPARKPNHENDGRPPDTEATLHPKGIRDVSTLNKFALQSYTWRSPNSCFFDHGLELWFIAFSLWTPLLQQEFISVLPTESFLASLFYHYDRRLKAIHNLADNDPLSISRNLDLMQGITKDRIFRCWNLYDNPDAHGDCKSWLIHAVNDRNTSQKTKEYLGVHDTIIRMCKAGHLTETDSPQNPQVMLSLITPQVRSSEDKANLGSYFSHYVPGDVKLPTTGRKVDRWAPLHELGGIPCSRERCALNASVTSIRTLWPQILNIESDTSGDPSDFCPGNIRMAFTDTFTFRDQNGGIPISYQLVGRVLHSTNHFTAQVRFGGNTYSYNDMRAKGSLVKMSDPTLLDQRNRKASYYVYHCVSEHAETCRNTENIRDDFSTHTSLTHSGKPISVASSSSDNTVAGWPILTSNKAVSQARDPMTSTGTKPATRGKRSSSAYSHCGIDCTNIERPLSEYDLHCSFCGDPWHEGCVSGTFAPGFDMMCNCWCCPVCINVPDGRWDTHMVGKYILLPADENNPSSCCYPALIERRTTMDVVTVIWHLGNVYSDDTPNGVSRDVSPQMCVQAYFHDFVNAKTLYGSIIWPVQLCEDAHDIHGYRNATIRVALEDSFGVILDILKGLVVHPIVSLLREWKDGSGKVKAGKEKAKRDVQARIAFSERFTLNLFPADYSLIESFTVDIRHYISCFNNATTMEDHRMVAYILFSVVIMWVYLGVDPLHDIQIFWLAYSPDYSTNLPYDDPYIEAKRGSILRLFSDTEKAMIASVIPERVDDDLPSSDWRRRPYFDLSENLRKTFRNGVPKGLKKLIDSTTEILPSIAIKNADGSQYSFSRPIPSDYGLAGGPSYSTHPDNIQDPDEIPSKLGARIIDPNYGPGLNVETNQDPGPEPSWKVTPSETEAPKRRLQSNGLEVRRTKRTKSTK